MTNEPVEDPEAVRPGIADVTAESANQIIKRLPPETRAKLVACLDEHSA